MNILFLGDVWGRDARDEIIRQVPELRKKYALDAVIVNVDNAAHGCGITPQICNDFYAAGADCLTGGDHIWNQREIIPHIERDKKLLRAVNYPEGTPGRGTCMIETPRGEKILVVHLMARLFMDPLDDPFAAVDKILKSHTLGKAANAIFIDIHGEATSEKMAMGHFCDGRASLIVGTHTHIPTADAQILPGGTGYQTDAGMCGSYDSVIGAEKSVALARFTNKLKLDRLSPAAGPVTLCGVLAVIDGKTGLCTAIRPLRIGGGISQSAPEAV